MTKIGIIGGSGLDDPDLLQNARDIEIDTKYGKPSALLKEGAIQGRDVVILARHGRAHTIPPTFVNYRANIQALKDVGCSMILATTACGSLRKEIDRGHLVILDQFIDFTRMRPVSFHEEFEPHGAVHTGMADPFDENIRSLMNQACETLGLAHHETGTVVTIEGSRFSTRAESNMFRLWGADVINMSVAPECILANEAGIPYVEHFRFGFVHQIAGYVYFSYFKPFSFPDVDLNINSFFIMGYFRFSYLGVDKTVVVVICGQLAYVLFQLILLEQAGIGEKMQKTVFIGGHHVFELFCRIGLITFKGYGSNIDPLVFLDIQDDPEIFFPVFLHSVRYFGVVVSFAGIESFKGFNVCFNFFLIQYLSGFDRQGVGDVIFT